MHKLILALVALMLAAPACAPEGADGTGGAATSEAEKKRDDPVKGVADNLGGIQRGSESGFGRAADMTR